MPPRTPDEIAQRRIHHLIGLFAVSVFFFLVTWLAGRGGDRGAPLLLWLLGLLAAMSLGGWIWLASRRVEQSTTLVDKLTKW